MAKDDIKITSESLPRGYIEAGERLLAELQQRQRLEEARLAESAKRFRRKIVLGLAWLVILSVAGFDGHFAWRNREDFSQWEENEIAIYLFTFGGIYLILFVKAFGLCLAGILTRFLNRPAVNYLLTFVFLIYSWVAIRYVHLFASLGEYAQYVFRL